MLLLSANKLNGIANARQEMKRTGTREIKDETSLINGLIITLLPFYGYDTVFMYVLNNLSFH